MKKVISTVEIKSLDGFKILGFSLLKNMKAKQNNTVCTSFQKRQGENMFGRLPRGLQQQQKRAGGIFCECHLLRIWKTPVQ